MARKPELASTPEALLGRTVVWVSQAAGSYVRKKGVVIAVRAPGKHAWTWLSEPHRQAEEMSPPSKRANPELATASSCVIVRVDSQGPATARKLVALPAPKYMLPRWNKLEIAQ